MTSFPNENSPSRGLSWGRPASGFQYLILDSVQTSRTGLLLALKQNAHEIESIVPLIPLSTLSQ